MSINKYLAEFLGTFILVGLGSMGIISVLGQTDAAGMVAIGLAFGLALLAGIWVVGHVSGAHFNPAVTLSMLVDGRVSFGDAIGYWVGQFAGAAVASLVVLAATDKAAVGLTVTGYTDRTTAIISETLLTAVFVWVIMTVVKRGANHAPVAIALTLTGVHLAGIPASGASVNPARSFGPAIVTGDFDQFWVYVVFPLLGALIAWGLYRLFPVQES